MVFDSPFNDLRDVLEGRCILSHHVVTEGNAVACVYQGKEEGGWGGEGHVIHVCNGQVTVTKNSRGIYATYRTYLQHRWCFTVQHFTNSTVVKC